MIMRIVYGAKKRWYFWLILIGIIALVWFLNRPGNGKKENTYTVKRQDLKETLSLSGEIDSKEKATLRFQSSGYLNWVGVQEGDMVKKYQVLASLDQRELQKNLEKYLNTYMKSRWDFEQNKEDNKGKAMTDALEKIADKYQFDLNNAVIDVELRDLSLKYANLWTPIEGIVTKVAAKNAGVNVTPTQAEIEVVNPNTVFLSITADQSEVGKLEDGKIGRITMDSYTEEKIDGAVSQIAFTPKAGETGTVYEVKVKLLGVDNTKYKYRIGMTGDVEFLVREMKNILAVPANYIKTEDGKKYVMVKAGDKKVKTFVVLGEEMDNGIEIKEGIKEGDVVVQ